MKKLDAKQLNRAHPRPKGQNRNMHLKEVGSKFKRGKKINLREAKMLFQYKCASFKGNNRRKLTVLKLTKKIMAPELVRECPGEVVGVAFHEEEAFGGFRRARWSAVQSAEIYVQEVAPYEFLSGLPLNVRSLIFQVAEDFESQVLAFLGR